MPNINYVTQTLAIKIVYYGPGLSGKTTNLRHIFNHLSPDSRGEFLCLETPTERTLFFDLLPVKAGMIREFKTRFHLMTVPGQVFYEASRKSVLKGVDGIVFVADSQVPLLDATLENFDALRKNLLEHETDINLIPMVFQYNKRDLDNLIPVETFNALLNSQNAPYIESCAVNGDGVFETLSEIAKLVVPKVREQIFWQKMKDDVSRASHDRDPTVDQESLIGHSKIKAMSRRADEMMRLVKMRFNSQEDVDKEIDELQKEFMK